VELQGDNVNISSKERLMQLLEQSDNQSCVDCEAPLPRWASIIAVSSPNDDFDFHPQQQQPQINIGFTQFHVTASLQRRLGDE
jgi:hypothetical protein